MTALQLVTLASAVWAVAGLAIATAGAWRRPTPAARAAPAGPAWRGIAYALGPEGMSPRAKESASAHPAVYAAGLLYHAGIVVGLATLPMLLRRIAIPAPTAMAVAVVTTGSAVAGLALFARRVASPLLRTISALDDYFANLLVDAWLIAAAFSAIRASASSTFLALSIVLAVYAPVGKVRHCVFFVLSRALYGARLGRRGLVGAR